MKTSCRIKHSERSICLVKTSVSEREEEREWLKSFLCVTLDGNLCSSRSFQQQRPKNTQNANIQNLRTQKETNTRQIYIQNNFIVSTGYHHNSYNETYIQILFWYGYIVKINKITSSYSLHAILKATETMPNLPSSHLRRTFVYLTHTHIHNHIEGENVRIDVAISVCTGTIIIALCMDVNVQFFDIEFHCYSIAFSAIVI